MLEFEFENRSYCLEANKIRQAIEKHECCMFLAYNYDYLMGTKKNKTKSRSRCIDDFVDAMNKLMFYDMSSDVLEVRNAVMMRRQKWFK
jgi:hypothetical protein